MRAKNLCYAHSHRYNPIQLHTVFYPALCNVYHVGEGNPVLRDNQSDIKGGLVGWFIPAGQGTPGISCLWSGADGESVYLECGYVTGHTERFGKIRNAMQTKNATLV